MQPPEKQRLSDTGSLSADPLIEERKRREQEWHDVFRGQQQATGDAKFTAYRKWYVAGVRGERWFYDWIQRRAKGARVLDYACGEGLGSVRVARWGLASEIIGIDISPVSVEMARSKAASEQLAIDFRVMDAEKTEFPDAFFDIVMCNGVLHHMELDAAYPEIARILKPGGHAVALEALGHNPLINLYRRRTPYLRSPDEHPLRKGDILSARRYFGSVDLRFFNLATLAAAPLWKTPLVQPVAWALNGLDRGLLRIPALQWHAWMAGIVMSRPLRARG